MNARIYDTAGRILCAAFLGRPGLVFALNGLSLGSIFIRSLDLGPPRQHAKLAVIGAVNSLSFIRSKARTIVAEMMSVSSKAGVQDLLGIMCDAVFVLDEHLVMASASPKLDALLLRRAPMNAADVGPFPSLFHVQDQERVVPRQS